MPAANYLPEVLETTQAERLATQVAIARGSDPARRFNNLIRKCRGHQDLR